MPKIKTKRDDILRQQETLKIIEKAQQVADWLPCCIALLWMFGKRISEVLQLKRENIYVDDRYLYVRFFVSKKKARKDPPVPKPYLKRISLKHIGVPYVLAHLEKVKEGPLFPNMYREKARYYFRKVTKKVWFHLFRESLATEMAEHGATEEDLMHWFDWDRVDTAHSYVKRGTKLTEKWSERTW